MGIIKQQTIKGTIYSYLGVLIGFISVMVIQPHALTPEQVGLTGILLSYSMMFAQFAGLGFGGTSRYFPYFRDAEKKHHGYLFLFCVVASIGTIIFVGLAYVLKDQLISSESQKSALFSQYYWYLVPLIIFTVFFNVFDLYARVLYNATSGRILREFTKRIFILVPIVLIYFKLVSFDTFMILWLIANIIPTAILTGRLIYDKHFFLEPDFKFLDKDMKRKLTQISVLGLFVGSSPLIVENIDKYVINSKYGLGDTGVYTLAFYFATVVTLPARSLYSIATTVISEAWKTNDLATISSIYKKSCINQLITTLFLLILIWANVDDIFHFLPGRYQSGKYVILFIAIGNLIDSATGVNGIILSSSKYFKYDGYFYLMLIGVTVGGNMLFIPYFGITGAAIAAACTYFIFNLFRYLFILFAFKMQPFTIASPITLLIGAIVYFGSVWLLPHLSNAILDIGMRSLFITAIYGSAVYYLNLSPDINKILNDIATKLGIRKLA